MLMVVTLLVSTTGITIYTHYCNSEGQAVSSLFSDEATCDHNNTAFVENACRHENNNCSADGTHECCSDVSKVFKISNTFYTSLLEKDSPQPIEIELFNIYSVSLLSESETAQTSNYLHEPPLIIAGKDRITLILQIRISPDPLS